jgi:hypothetical protein
MIMQMIYKKLNLDHQRINNSTVILLMSTSINAGKVKAKSTQIRKSRKKIKLFQSEGK